MSKKLGIGDTFPNLTVIDAGGKILASRYSDGPIGRIDAADVIKVINFREAQLRK